MRGRKTGLLAVYLVGLGFAVLSPLPSFRADPAASPTFVDWLLPLGWLADLLRNLVLFVPLGSLLAAFGRSIRNILSIGLALALTIEWVQLMIPGRTASALDLIANTIGTAVGALIVMHWNGLIRPSPRIAMRLSLISCGAFVGLLMALPWLMQPIFEEGTYFGGWTPEFGHLQIYRGRILEARIGETRVPAFGPSSDTTRLKGELERDAAIFLRVVMGPPTTALAPLVTIHDDQQHEILFLGIEGADLVVRRRLRASVLGLENPSWRFFGAFRQSKLGERVDLEIVAKGPLQLDLVVAGEGPRILRWSPGRTWALLLQPPAGLSAVLPLMGSGWIAILIFPAAFWARRRAGGWIGLGASLLTLAVLPEVGMLEACPPHEWAGILVGVGAGIYCSRRVGLASKSRLESGRIFPES